jgi:type II secretory pathway component PulK
MLGRGSSRSSGSSRLELEAGQASVELVAVLPLVMLAGLVAWQLLLAGHSLWLCANAARAAARADTVGRSAESAARSALPEALERDLSVDRLREGGVRVSVRVPAVLQSFGTPVRVSARASLGRRE